MIRLENVALSAGSKELLQGAEFHLTPKMRLGLVGRNGTGKSTLLKAMMGLIDIDEGTIHLRAGLKIGYLPQDAVSGSEASLWDEVQSQMTELLGKKRAMERAQSDVEAHKEGAAQRLADTTDIFRIAGGFALEERIGEVLHGLGFSKTDWTRPCSVFSGGWQMRIALARLLLSEPGVLLLDEPTNHLDIHARTWLASFLARYPHAIIIVSHDRHLLDTLATHIVEVRNKVLHCFKGTLSGWMAERELRMEQSAKAFSNQQDEIARLERFVTRFKAKATKAAQARSRQKTLDRMERIEAPEREGRPRFVLPQAPGCSHETLRLKSAELGWSPEATLLSGVDFTLPRGARIAVLGENGGGKSTLLKSLSGTLPLLGGQRVVGKDVRIGVFSQDLAQSLDRDSTAIETVLASAPGALPTQVRSALGSLGLPGDMALRPVGLLSGGEKARVALACFAVRPYNVLLLDEPTNHLDAITVQVLAESLTHFEGAIFLVSHDRWLVKQVATHILHVENGTLRLKEGVDDADFERAGPQRDRSEAKVKKQDYAQRKKQQRELSRAQKRLDAIANLIEAHDAKIAKLEEAMYSAGADHQTLSELAGQQKETETTIAALYEEWEQLEDLLAEHP